MRVETLARPPGVFDSTLATYAARAAASPVTWRPKSKKPSPKTGLSA
jgi:hypothetical protein